MSQVHPGLAVQWCERAAAGQPIAMTSWEQYQLLAHYLRANGIEPPKYDESRPLCAADYATEEFSRRTK